MKRLKPFFILLTVPAMLFGMSCSNQSKETNEANDSASVVEVSEIIEVPESSDETGYSDAPAGNYDNQNTEVYIPSENNVPESHAPVQSLDDYDGN